jgi:CelD/BcsL family acetyltransferase involved in cellulose biosynthesis
MHTAPVRIEVVRSLDHLEASSAQWSALIESAVPGRGFFFALPRLRAMASVHAAQRHPGGHRSPYLLLAWRDDALVGALPLVRERKPLTRGGIRRLMLWGGDGSALGAETDVPILGTNHEATTVAHAFRTALCEVPGGDFDLMDLSGIREDSASLSALKAAFPDGSWSPEESECFHTDLSMGFEAYRATRSSGRIRELGRLRRRFEADHAVCIVEVRELSDGQLRQVMALHGARQQVLRGAGWRRESVFEHTGSRDALTTLLRGAAASGESRHRLLYAGDTLVSFLLGFECQGTFVAWLTAVNADFLAYGPGGILFWEVVQREFSRGTPGRIEFGVGRTFVKETVSTHALRPQRLEWVRPGAAPLSRLRLGSYRTLSVLRERLAARAARPPAS